MAVVVLSLLSSLLLSVALSLSSKMPPNIHRLGSSDYIRRFSSLEAADQIKCAILGCGMMGQEHISYIAGYDTLRLVYLCDPHQASLDKAVEIFQQHQNHTATHDIFHMTPRLLHDEKDLLEYANDIDLLVIASPNYLHYESLERWAPYDHVVILVEKPVAVSRAQHEALVDLSLSSNFGPHIWVAMEYRYIPAIAKLLSLLPTIGDLKMVTIRENRYPFLHKVEAWNRDRTKTGDSVRESGTDVEYTALHRPADQTLKTFLSLLSIVGGKVLSLF